MTDISVVIPLANGARYVEETLDSLGAQTMAPREVLVVDDGSDDDGPKKVGAYRFPDGTRPRLIQTARNAGVAATRNRGAYESSGSWIGLCDQDDLWHPRRLEMLSESIALHPEAIAVASGALGFAAETEKSLLRDHPRGQMIDHWVSGHPLGALCATIDPLPEPCFRHIRFENLQNDPCFVTTQVVVRRDAYFAAGGCVPICWTADDWLLNASLAKIEPIVMIDIPLVFYRVRAGSQSHDEGASARGILTAILALRLGGSRPDLHPAGNLYGHLVGVEARSASDLRRSLGFALLGDLGLGQIIRLGAGVLKRRAKRAVNERYKTPRRTITELRR